ncbi:MAG: glycosyltransferase family 2 protein [Pseudomonadota bacterium]
MAKPAESSLRRLPLTVTIIACNEAARLPRTLAAVGFADEILLLDSGSTDATIEIAEAHGARVERVDWPGYGQQKRRAEAWARHDWILNLDADEVVTAALAKEIETLFEAHEGSPPAPGYALRILNVYPGDSAPRPFANDYRVVRLYDRRRASYRDHPLFDRVEIETNEGAGRLRSPVHHFPFTDWAALVDKENRYTSYVAEMAKPRSGAVLLLRLVTEMPIVFFKTWLFRGHVFGGWKGFAFALVVGFARTLRVIKLLSRQTLPSQSDQNDNLR